LPRKLLVEASDTLISAILIAVSLLQKSVHFRKETPLTVYEPKERVLENPMVLSPNCRGEASAFSVGY